MGWEIKLQGPGVADVGDELILPHNTVNFTGWTDPTAGLNFLTSLGHNCRWFFNRYNVYHHPPSKSPQAVRDNSTVFTGSDYATDPLVSQRESA